MSKINEIKENNDISKKLDRISRFLIDKKLIEMELIIFHNCVSLQENKCRICYFCKMLKKFDIYSELHDLAKRYHFFKISEYMHENYVLKDASFYKIFKLKGNIVENDFEKESLIAEREKIVGYDDIVDRRFPSWYLKVQTIDSEECEVFRWMGLHKDNSKGENDGSRYSIHSELVEVLNLIIMMIKQL